MNRADPASTPHIGYPSSSDDQIDQPGAFGVHRRPGGGQLVDLPADDVVGRQLRGELLGEAAGQQHRVRAVGQRVDERVELDHVGTGGPQQLGMLGVAEAERLSRRQRDRRLCGCARRLASPLPPPGSHGGSATRLRGGRNTAARSTWRATRAVIASTASRARRPYSTAVTRPRYLVGSSNSATRGNRAQHRDAGLLAGLPQHLLMPGRPDPVEDDAGDPGRGIERRKAVQQCGDAVALAARVDHQDDRRAEQTGDVCGGARRRGRRQPGPIRPSNSPITPSITAMSAPAAPWAYSGPMSRSPTSTGSRLRPGRPAASAW